MRAVIFDVAGVLIAWKPKLLYAKLVPDADLREYFLAEVSRAPGVGIAAHRYTWITPLRRELRARGFLPIPPVLLPKR